MKLCQLNEGLDLNRDMIVVDVQPFYHKYHKHITPLLIQYINKSKGDILWFHNGCNVGIEDTVIEQMQYLIEWGIDEDRLEEIKFHEKDYAFFRGWMDTGVLHDNIIIVGKYMLKHNKTDSRDLTEKDYGRMFLNDEDLLQDLVNKSDPLIMPDIDASMLKAYNNAYLAGGGRNECLEEIRLYMEMLNMNYKVADAFVY